MAQKKKTKSSKSPAKKQPASKKPKSSPSFAPAETLTASLASAPPASTPVELTTDAPPFNCPYKVYEGVVRLDSNNRKSFLQTGLHTYLMSVDPDCSGIINSTRVDAAYGAFSQNPGNNQPLRCNAFLHEDGTTIVLHVVSRAAA